jgi:hypothetical protein
MSTAEEQESGRPVPRIGRDSDFDWKGTALITMVIALLAAQFIAFALIDSMRGGRD